MGTIKPIPINRARVSKPMTARQLRQQARWHREAAERLEDLADAVGRRERWQNNGLEYGDVAHPAP